MAVIENTIGSGQDYATVQAWADFVDDQTLGTNIYKGVIMDAAEFNENVNIDHVGSGTPSATSYFWLTAHPSVRHNGKTGVGARIRGSTNGSHVITVSVNFTRIDWLEIQQDSTGSSDEGIRITSDDVLIDYCIIWSDTDTDEQDGIYVDDGASGQTRSISNCIIYGFRRAQIQVQYNSAFTATVNVDHCTLVHQSGTAPTTVSQGALAVRSPAGSAITVNVYNTIGYMELGTDEPFLDGVSGDERGNTLGSMVWNGSNNLRGDQGTGAQIDGTNNTTSWQSATDGDSATSQGSGSYVVFKNISAGTEDFRLLDASAGNLAAGNGTNRQGSEPDTRQDFSVDIEGNIRSTTLNDIGAHAVNSQAFYLRSLLASNQGLRSPNRKLLLSERKV